MSKKIIIFQKLNIDIILFCCKASFEYNQYTDANLMQSKKEDSCKLSYIDIGMMYLALENSI